MKTFNIGFILAMEVILHIAVALAIIIAAGCALVFLDRMGMPTWTIFIGTAIFMFVLGTCLLSAYNGCVDAWYAWDRRVRDREFARRTAQFHAERWDAHHPVATKERWESLLP